MNKSINIFKEDSEYFGFKFNKKGELKFLIPKFIKPEQNINNFETFKLLNVYSKIIHKYNQTKKNELTDSDITEFFEHNTSINGYIMLILDYMENGDFFLYEHFYNNGNKKINWNKTLNNTDIIIQDNTIIYNYFITKNKSKNNSDDFYKLYLFTLSNAWDLFFNQKLFHSNLNLFFSNSKIKSIINQFCDEHFKDREIEIANILKTIYQSKDIKSISKREIKNEYCTEIHYIWETMIESLIPDNIKKTNKQKRGQYIRIKDNKTIEGLKTEPDHIIKFSNEKKIYILDSKFYSLYNNFENQRQPRSESINKQETYKKLVQKENPQYVVKNIFVFPKNDKKDIEHFANHRLKNDNTEDFLIHCLAIDFFDVSKFYIKNNKSPSFIDFIKKI